MISISIKRDREKNIVEYEVTGHAGYDEYGKDVVCGAVSALAQASVIGLINVAGINVKYSIGDGRLHCIIPPLDRLGRREANILLDTMFYALEDIRKSYPENVLISETEV